MPGLHHGNLCWGNRKAFYIYGEYPSEAMLNMDFRRSEITNQTNSIYISTASGYYGYQNKITSHMNDESMDTAENKLQMPYNMVCRKRQNNEPNIDHVKRSRYQEGSESSETFHHRDGRTSHISTYNLGFYML